MATEPRPGHVTPSRPLVIGVGNRDRGDDGVGPLVAQAFAERWPERAEIHLAEGDLSDLLLRWRGDQDVVIIDAIVSGRPPGTISTMDGLHEGLSKNDRLVSSHGVGIVEVIALAKALDKRPAAITIVGVEAAQCEHFSGLSQPVAAALPAAVNEISDVLDDAVATIDAGERTSSNGKAADEAGPRNC